MSDAADVVVVKGYLKWMPKMKLYLVKAVKVNRAHIKTKKLQFQEKYVKVCASQIEETDQEKKVKTEKKKVVADITEVIQSGGGKSGLAKLASEMKSTGDAYLSGKTDNFVKGFSESCSSTTKTASTDVKSEIKVKNISAVTAESSTRKRKLSRTECEGEDLMRTFSDQFLREDQAEAERMRNLEETIRVSGEATAAAIAAGNEEIARANRALFAMLSSLLGSK
jgi:hypothetical protein